MDRTIARSVGAALVLLGLPIIFGAPIYGWIFLIVGAVVALWGWWEKIFPPLPDINEFPAHNALNLKITNMYDKSGLGGVQLSLHSIQRWRADRRDFGIAESFAPHIPMVLFADQIDLPYRVPRMFQLVEFKDSSAPLIRGRAKGENGPAREILIPSHGIWRARLELRWGGGAKEHVVFFEWNENKLPTFCKKPR